MRIRVLKPHQWSLPKQSRLKVRWVRESAMVRAKYDSITRLSAAASPIRKKRQSVMVLRTKVRWRPLSGRNAKVRWFYTLKCDGVPYQGEILTFDGLILVVKTGHWMWIDIFGKVSQPPSLWTVLSVESVTAILADNCATSGKCHTATLADNCATSGKCYTATLADNCATSGKCHTATRADNCATSGKCHTATRADNCATSGKCHTATRADNCATSGKCHSHPRW